jgi:hypothetical protein
MRNKLTRKRKSVARRTERLTKVMAMAHERYASVFRRLAESAATAR